MVSCFHHGMIEVFSRWHAILNQYLTAPLQMQAYRSQQVHPMSLSTSPLVCSGEVGRINIVLLAKKGESSDI